MNRVSRKPGLILVSPALANANNGNWHTARRWAQCLSSRFHVRLEPHWDGPAALAPDADAMIALHARRSAPSIHAWAKHSPGKPLILILTGTDLYRDIHVDVDAQQSLAMATHLVVLQEAGLQDLPEAFRCKTSVIYQSARALKPALKPGWPFRAVMVGHLREEKDPRTWLRTAHRLTTEATSRHPLVFDQIGNALTPELARAARAAEKSIPGYRWLGGLPPARTRQYIKRAHVLVNSSRMEGGAQVILQAVQCGTPVLASHIRGNVGMLGTGYAGYFPAGDDRALAVLLRRCADDREFLALLERQCHERAKLFDRAEEKRRVINLVTSALKAKP